MRCFQFPETTIGFVLPGVSRVDLRVYDVLGREVVRLLEEERGVGYHMVKWNAGGLASGFYLYRLVVHPVGAIRESPLHSRIAPTFANRPYIRESPLHSRIARVELSTTAFHAHAEPRTTAFHARVE